MQLINQFHCARKVNSNVVVLTSVFLRVKFVMHKKITRIYGEDEPISCGDCCLDALGVGLFH